VGQRIGSNAGNHARHRRPGPLYTGDIAAAATMINEPLRRWRTVGADLLVELAEHTPIDVWGIDTAALNSAVPGRVRGKGDVPSRRLMRHVARRRVYLHTARWTSLGISLIEAMYLGMPVVAVRPRWRRWWYPRRRAS
jgi:glycosyltransferase involved in cell wall biosynthesis